jgi:hypothetical protein
MPRLPGISQKEAVRVFQKLGYRVVCESGPAFEKPAYEDFIDHGLNQRKVSSDVGKEDNIMQVVGKSGIIDNDKTAGLTWLWGSKFDQIVTGRLSKNIDALNNTKQGQHHGPDQAPMNTWYYRDTIKDIGMSTIE